MRLREPTVSAVIRASKVFPFGDVPPIINRFVPTGVSGTATGNVPADELGCASTGFHEAVFGS